MLASFLFVQTVMLYSVHQLVDQKFLVFPACSVISDRFVVMVICYNFFSSLLGIVYCFSRKDSEQVTMDLCQQGIRAGCYHADLPSSDRSRVHKQWLNNTIKVVKNLSFLASYKTENRFFLLFLFPLGYCSYCRLWYGYRQA